MKKGLLLLAAMMMAFSAWADGNNYGPAAYLDYGAGSRATGMGGAFVALADDATAGFWNPAGLAQMDLYRYQFGMQYAYLANDMNSSYLAYSFQLPDIGCFSASWMNFSIHDIEGRDENGELAGTFGSSENIFIASFGRKVYEWVKGLSLGINVKMLHQGLGDYAAFGHGLDIGAIWQPVLYWDHTVGVQVQNLLQRLYWQDTDAVDASLVNAVAGVALRFLPSADEMYFYHLISAFDFKFSEYNRFDYRLGVEYWYIQSIGARAGYNSREVTMGASYREDLYEVDYAFHYSVTEIQAHQHRLTLSLRFK
ncbi:PorV/PorQ family protein [candidate division FCPU426 bacterium]|nr:PorV/PorQ family protein [candidate division FCPU426 bacterium]